MATEVVAVDADGDAAYECLAALLGGVCFFGEEDEACAGAPCWFLLDSFRRTVISIVLHKTLQDCNRGRLWAFLLAGGALMSPQCMEGYSLDKVLQWLEKT